LAFGKFIFVLIATSASCESITLMKLLISPQPSLPLFQLALIELAVTEGMEIEHFDWEEAKYLIRANGADSELKAQVAQQAQIAESYLAKVFTNRNQIYQITDNSLIVN
jgi:hypothetical protein